MKHTVQKSVIVDGDPMNPNGSDLIAQVATIPVGEFIPNGWIVLTGNNHTTQIACVAYRSELKS